MLQNTKFQVEVDLMYGTLRHALEWCERNCTGEWHYSEGHGNPEVWPVTSNNWIFIFDTERDYVAFTIWKT